MKLIGKLTALKVGKAGARGYYNDGGGLYLAISPGGAKSWVFRYRIGGRLREMGLGPTHTVSLTEARDKALECRKQRRKDIDPIEARRAVRASARLEEAKAITFKQSTQAYIEAHQIRWSSAKHAHIWIASLETYVFPIIGTLPVQAIDTQLVLKVLEPIWITKHVSATRLRGRIESVLDWARSRGYREGENPARWKGHLENLLPKDIREVRHFAALPYEELPKFMAALRQIGTYAAWGLEFLILTAAREGMLTSWRNDKISGSIWTIPADRMKGRQDFRVPLSPRAQELVLNLEWATPGATAMRDLLKRMGYAHLTIHGFRSTFSDWCSECTSFSSEVREMALAHTIKNKVEEAYRRGDLLEKRRELMDAWANFCSQPIW